MQENYLEGKMEEHMQEMMQMSMYWGNKCTFLFDSLSSQNDAGFCLGLFVCLIMGIVTQFLQFHVQSHKINRNENLMNRLFLTFQYAIYYLLAVLTMLLIMTFNGWVLIIVSLGNTLGFLFSQFYSTQQDEFEVQKLIQ